MLVQVTRYKINLRCSAWGNNRQFGGKYYALDQSGKEQTLSLAVAMSLCFSFVKFHNGIKMPLSLV